MLNSKLDAYLPRRVVTGNRNGKSLVISDGPVPNAHLHIATPGLMSAVIWTTAPVPQLTSEPFEQASRGVQITPKPGGTTLLIVTFPPDAVMATPRFDPVGADAEYREHLPGLAELFEQDHPGMHTTESIDYDIVLDGEIWLELDDGVQTRMSTGDVAVQCGTRHAWRNKSDRATTMAFVFVGATRP